MPEKEKFPTLFDDENYLIFRSDDNEIVTLVDHDRGTSAMFTCKAWHEFARAIVAAANKDCENEKEVNEQTCSVSDTIHRLVENAIKPLQDRIEELERIESTECEASDDVISIVNTVQEHEEVDVPKVILADEGTIMGDFQKERTDAISEMFDNVDECRVYPTTQFFKRLDAALEKALTRVRSEEVPTEHEHVCRDDKGVILKS